jgi:uncharacterized protein
MVYRSAMRLYAVADIHAKPERLQRVQESVRRYAPDVLLVAGDINNYIQPRAAFKHLNAMGIPVLIVLGNSDRAWHERCLPEYIHLSTLNERKVSLNGLVFAGISGTLPLPFRSRLRLFEKKMVERMRRLVCAETILVVHPPPLGTCDRVLGRLSAGSRAVAQIIAACTPRIVFCGHIHEDRGMAMVGRTLVINCSMGASGSGVVVDLDPLDPSSAPVVVM